MNPHHVATALMVKQVSDELMKDVWRCHSEIQRFSVVPDAKTKAEGQFWLRTFVRAFFAQVEGIAYALRHLVLFLTDSGQYPLSLGEQTILKEVAFRYRNGKVVEHPAYLTPIEGLELGFYHFARAHGSKLALNKGDHRFAAFKRTLELRHTLSHPKNIGDLALSPDHIREFADAIGWFANEISRLFKESFHEILEEPSI